MCRYLIRVGTPFTNPGPVVFTEIELDPSKEEIVKSAAGLQWHDKRDPRWPAWRLIHPVQQKLTRI